MKVPVYKVFFSSGKFFAAGRIQNHSSSKVLTHIVLQGNNLYVIHKAALHQTVFNFRQRDSLFFYFYNRIRAALQQKATVFKKFCKVRRSKTGRIFNVWRNYPEAAVLSEPQLCIVKRSKLKSVLILLTIRNSACFRRAVNFQRAKAEQFFRTDRQFRTARSATRKNPCIPLLKRKLFFNFNRPLKKSRRRNNHIFFIIKRFKFFRVGNPSTAERNPKRKRKR